MGAIRVRRYAGTRPGICLDCGRNVQFQVYRSYAKPGRLDVLGRVWHRHVRYALRCPSCDATRYLVAGSPRVDLRS